VGQPASAAGESQVQERTDVIPLSEYLKNKDYIVFCCLELTGGERRETKNISFHM